MGTDTRRLSFRLFLMKMVDVELSFIWGDAQVCAFAA